tara:strand:+ start:109 stop:393 length:285 start_codon:yes stop_codon:yes gene_type:complete
MPTRKRLSPVKEKSTEGKAFKRKYTVKVSKTNPIKLLKKLRPLLTASSYDRRTKQAPRKDGHGNKVKLPVGRKSRKKRKKRKKRNKTIRKRRKK